MALLSPSGSAMFVWTLPIFLFTDFTLNMPLHLYPVQILQLIIVILTSLGLFSANVWDGVNHLPALCLAEQALLKQNKEP